MGPRLRGDDIVGEAISRAHCCLVIRIQFSNSSHVQMCAIAPVVVTARGRPKLLSFRPRALGACPIRATPNEGARNAGCASASAAPCAKKRKHTSVVATVTPFTSGVPHAVGFRLASCSPRWTMLRHRVPAEGVRLRLEAALCRTDASFGRRDHTTWAGAHSVVRQPSRAPLTRLRILRTPLRVRARDPGLCPATSFRPDAAAPPHPASRIVTIAKRPSSTGRDE